MTDAHLPFPSIAQFRNVINNVKFRAHYARTNQQTGEDIFDRSKPIPTLRFKGTVKLHGTNAAVCGEFCGSVMAFWAQSRENIITPTEDNAGFAKFAEANNDMFIDLMLTAKSVYGNEKLGSKPKVSIFGEWCGGNIQKSVAISGLPKMFVIFAIKVYGQDDESFWLSEAQIKDVIDGYGMKEMNEHNVFNINNFPTYTIDIDFNYPELVQNDLGAITLSVENECPVGASFNQLGVGEGVVWSCVTPGWSSSKYWFKVKGEKHSVSKVKTLAAVDVEKVNSIIEFVETVVTENRLKQGLDYLRTQHLDIDPKNMSVFLRWLHADVMKEESDTAEASGLSEKEIGKAVSNKGRPWFLNNIT